MNLMQRHRSAMDFQTSAITIAVGGDARVGYLNSHLRLVKLLRSQ